MRKIFLGQLIVAIGVFTAPTAMAQPKCVHPDVNKFLDQSSADTGIYGGFPPDLPVIFQPFKLGDSYYQWMGASWEGPPEGTLFVLDCRGNKVAALRVGEFEQLRAGPEISGFGKTLEVTDIPGESTDDQEDDVNLIAFSGNSILLLWNHEASEVVYDPGYHYEGITEPWYDYTDQYAWRYSKSGTIIQVTGKRVVGDHIDPDHGWAPHTVHDLPSEEFCWNEAQRHYTVCRGQE